MTIKNSDFCCVNVISQKQPNKKRRRREKTDDSEVAFHVFRAETVRKHRSLAWLGPASMAVVWYRTYLSSNWTRLSSDKVDFSKDTTGNRKESKRNKRRKRINFYHIPDQYTSDYTPKDIIENGIPGAHYADSYISLYNMIRRYGQFRSNEMNEEVMLIGYQGPILLMK
jgi:hypothetical protein